MLLKLKKYKILLFVTGAIISIIWGGKDSNFWGLVDENVEKILLDVQKGKRESKDIQLSLDQKNEITELITANPTDYTDAQKSLISIKSGKEILNEIATGTLDVKSVQLNFEQFREITELINKAPSNYSEKQKLLIAEESAESILFSVGMGYTDPFTIKLSTKQRKEIKQLLLSNPHKYSDVQKELIPELKSTLKKLTVNKEVKEIPSKVELEKMTGEQILHEVGMGNLDPKDLKLTSSQFEEIKSLIQKNSAQYNENQKSLIK